MRTLWTFALLIVAVSCVDRINFDPPLPGAFPVVIDGFISDQPGPYEVRISKAFDIQSKSVLKQMVNVNKISISDNVGNTEQLVRITDGVYQTFGSMQGQVGRAYSLRVELLDGRVYESEPDTLYPAGTVDQVYQEWDAHVNDQGAQAYGFNVFFNSTAGNQQHYQFLWKFIGTYQVDTTPENFTQPCGESVCATPLPCSSFRLTSNGLEYVKPCECCVCWVNIYNDLPLVSDDQLVNEGKFTKVKAGYVPLTQWTLLHKVHAEVQQFSLSPAAFNFWRAVKAQKAATTSLFQPLIGKIPGNFHQVSGITGPAVGIFYASSVRKNSVFIQRSDVPNASLIPQRDGPYNYSCLSFGNATNVQPDFWQ
jgi:hypothetical protein